MFYSIRAILSGALACCAITGAGADVIRGVVTDSATQTGLYRVKVFSDTLHSVYTDSNGAFALTTDGPSGVTYRGRGNYRGGENAGVDWNPERRVFSWPDRPGSVSIRIWDPSGAAGEEKDGIASGAAASFALPELRPGIHFIRFRGQGLESVFRILQLADGKPGAVRILSVGPVGSAGASGALRKGSAGSAVNAVTFQRPGWRTVNLDVTGSNPDVQVKMGFAPADTTASLHPFFFAAEGVAAMSIVRGGKVTWSYSPDIKGGEISDASLLANGNVVYAWEYGATEIGPDKRVIWNYPAAGSDQIHTCQPIGLDKVFIVSNGNPARARIIDTRTNAILMDKVVKSGGTGVHGQFRNCRMTKAGTMLLAHMDVGGSSGSLYAVEEYDTASMQVIWSSKAVNGPWDAVRLRNGNTLISAATSNAVFEISKAGKIEWQVSNTAPFDIPGIKLANNQTAQRLENGNTLITNWQEPDNAPKIIEITPSRRVVWALNTKNNAPFAKTSTSMQLLDEPGAMEEFGLQR